MENFKNSKFFKFAISGIVNNVIYYMVYYAIVFINHNLFVVANIVAYLVSIFSAFLLNSNYVFNEKSINKYHIVKTYATYGFSLLISTFVLWYLVKELNISEMVSPLISLFVTVPLNFIINKTWVYKNK